MSEEEKAAYIAEREAKGIIPTVRLAVNESVVSTNGMISLKATSI